MKLVDILARELKEWPASQCSIHQGVVGNLFTIENGRLGIAVEKADDWLDAEVNPAQWQAAVDALKGGNSQEKVMDIDWSKAPEGATHWHPNTEGYTSHWYKDGFFCVCSFESDGWVEDLAPINDMSQYIAHPIRTAEQIAAEEKQNAWLAGIAAEYDQETADKCAAVLVAGGYRKRVKE